MTSEPMRDPVTDPLPTPSNGALVVIDSLDRTEPRTERAGRNPNPNPIEIHKQRRQ
jgi:hypothetical protein